LVDGLGELIDVLQSCLFEYFLEHAEEIEEFESDSFDLINGELCSEGTNVLGDIHYLELRRVV
jgi:hypothetical protein